MKQEVTLVRVADGKEIETMSWTNKPRGKEGESYDVKATKSFLVFSQKYPLTKNQYT